VGHWKGAPGCVRTGSQFVILKLRILAVTLLEKENIRTLFLYLEKQGPPYYGTVQVNLIETKLECKIG